MPDARTKDSGTYACSISDIMSNESQIKELTITVYGTVQITLIHSFMHGTYSIYCIQTGDIDIVSLHYLIREKHHCQSVKSHCLSSVYPDESALF